MSLDASLVGYTTRWFEQRLDGRWTMAYAAALGDPCTAYFDDRDGHIAAVHPLFAVCLEWPALVDSLAQNGIDMHRTVHATHDISLHAPILPPCTLYSRARVIGIEQRPPGLYLGWRLDTVDADGRLLAQSWQGNLFLGETLRGAPQWETPLPEQDVVAVPTRGQGALALALPAGFAHVYTECARIWNPLHTEFAVAAAAGMAAPPLHGTATLARAVSALVTVGLDGDPTRVRRLGARFNAPVLLPSTLTLTWMNDHANHRLCFEAHTAAGGRALRNGFIDYT